MIWRHLATFVWLQERLRHNQARKAPLAGVITRILRIVVIAAGVAAFAAFFAIGRLALDGATPAIVLLAWDGLVVGFLFFWLIGLITQLQRAEILSADRFLTFPVPPRVVFLVNYLGAGVLSADVIVFGSGMMGLAAGLVLARGPGMIWLVPLVVAFLVLVTAASHQLQGWLAALMTNKRRRRHIVALATVLAVLVIVPVSQIAPLSSRLVAMSAGVSADEMSELRRELRRLREARRAGRIDEAAYAIESAEARGQLDRLTAAVDAERRRLVERLAVPAHRWIPIGWLPYGAMTLAEGRFVPSILGTLGMMLLGLASLGRSYRTTMRLYLGTVGGAAPGAAPAVAAPRPRPDRRAGSNLLERRIPWISEHASAITLAGVRSLTRAPEAKLMLLGPAIMVVVFGGLFLGPAGRSFSMPDSDPSVFVRPLMATGLVVMVLLGMNQISANLFGFDRDGFRVFVLAAAARKDVLLGKNLALMPLALGLGLGAIVIVQPFAPMRGDHFVAMIAQAVSIYLVYCLVANLLSIYAPVPVKAGSMKPVRTNLTVIVANVVGLFAFPLAIAPTLVPLGVEAALDVWADVRGVPIYLALSLVQVAVVGVVYARLLEWQGGLLQAREQRILERVTVTAE